jgi:hypothetical protein
VIAYNFIQEAPHLDEIARRADWKRAPFDAKHIGRRVRDPQIVVALPKGTRLMFTDGGNDKFTLGIWYASRGKTTFYAARSRLASEPPGRRA